MNNPLVSISCITYNHAPYIRECLDGFLMQKCDFDFEVLIHDDASTDGTQEIIKEYQEKYPEIIKPIFQNENQYSKGVRGIMAKFNFPRAKGKYIALCEGDDYWVDLDKLQRQVRFLEENEEYSLVAENSKVIDERNGLEYFFSKLKMPSEIKMEELVKGRKFHTASVLFQREKLHLPTNYNEFPFGDTLIFSALGKNGKIMLFPQTSTVYRRNEGGMSTGFDRLAWAEKVEKFNLLLDDFLEGKFKNIHRKNIERNYYSALKWGIKNFQIGKTVKAFFKYLKYKF